MDAIRHQNLRLAIRLTFRGTGPLPWNPALEPNLEARFLYTKTGAIQPASGNAWESPAKQMIENLNLNTEPLSQARAAVQEQVGKQLKAGKKPQALLRVANAVDKDCALRPFVQVVINYLEKKARQS